MGSNTSDLRTRLATAVVALIVVLTLIWVPQLHAALTLFVAAIAAIGIHEYLSFARARGIEPMPWVAETLGAVIVVMAIDGEPVLMSAALAGGLFVIALLHLSRTETSIVEVATATFGLVYVAWFAGHIVLLHAFPQGAGLVMLLLVAVALTDTGAYFAGRAFGKHKFAPVVSPKKTWEGAFGGALATMLGLLIVYLLRVWFDWAALPDWPAQRYLLTGAALTVAAQVGDLTASSFKRNAGFKDSGILFPGHGGVLDRCDGFLFAAPVLYYIAVL